MHPHHHAVYGPSGISQTLLGQWLGLQQPQISRFSDRCFGWLLIDAMTSNFPDHERSMSAVVLWCSGVIK
jgi:hypothetical protein